MSPRSTHVISLVSTVFFCKNQQVKLTSEFQSSSQTASLDLFITIAMIIVTINAMCLVTQLCLTLCNPLDVAFQTPLPMGILKAGILGGLPCPPPGDLPNQGSNPGLPHCRQILYHLSHQGSNYKYYHYPKKPF